MSRLTCMYFFDNHDQNAQDRKEKRDLQGAGEEGRNDGWVGRWLLLVSIKLYIYVVIFLIM